MKKQIFGIAALSLLFVATSCSNETIESGNDLKNQISFRAVIGKQTKASEFTGWTTNDELTVDAYPVNSAVLTKTFALTYNGAAWSYPVPFSQPGYALRYYSYYPDANVTPLTATASSYSFDYTIQAPQEDLIAATAITDGTTVTLPFSHILSQVNFALVKIPGVQISITGISVNDVKNSGTYTFGTGWDLGVSTDDYSYTPESGTDETDGETGGISYMGNGNNINTFGNALMLMPQGFATAADGTFSFNYSLAPVNPDGTYDTPKTGAVEVNLCDFDVTEWAAGKRYLYVIDFSTFLAGGPITFIVTLDEWTDNDEPVVAETLIVADAELTSIEAAIAKHSAAKTSSPSLTVFPIAVPDDITADLEIENIAGFVSGDQIRIEFPASTSTTFLLLDSGLDATWTKSVNGRVVILTKN